MDSCQTLVTCFFKLLHKLQDQYPSQVLSLVQATSSRVQRQRCAGLSEWAPRFSGSRDGTGWTFSSPSSCPPRSASIISTSRLEGLRIFNAASSKEAGTPAVLPSSLRALSTLTDTGSSFSNLCWPLGRQSRCSQSQVQESSRESHSVQPASGWRSHESQEDPSMLGARARLRNPPSAAHCKLAAVMAEPSCR